MNGVDMGRIVISQNVSLDGVVEDPTGGEGFKHGGWFTEHMGPDRERWAEVEFAEVRGASALLMGRRTDHYFGSRWSSAPGPWADRLRELPKYVLSSTIEQTVWTNGTVLTGDVVEEVEKLKANIEGEIVVYASRPLVHALMENGLVDEIRLIVFPVVLGSGERAFGDTTDKTSLRLLKVECIGETLNHVRYEVVRN
jgi:dihydrofolate reductase